MKVVDLFSGCGGMSLGFQKVGFNIVAAYDSWKTAVKCYASNFKHPIYQVDLSQTNTIIRHILKIKPDILIGGPPCQDFSHAGKRSEGTRANLTVAFAKIIATIKPSLFVMENVDRSRKSEAYESAKSIMTRAGYGLTERVLDASRCGTPQRRKRFFVIGCMGESDDFMGNYIDRKIANHPMTVQDYLGDELDIKYYYRHPRNYSRRGIFSIDEPAPTIRGVNRPVPKGYLGHPGDPIPLNAQVRPLTTLERARIQTFPKSFKWVGTKTEVEQMIGNAIPVKLGSFVARSIKIYLSERQQSLNVSSG